jgi:putative oxidoreductase
MATVAGASEAGGGALLALGLLTPLGAAATIGVMTVASVSVHGDKGLWATNGGYELPMLYAVAAAALAFTGPGSWSVDHAAGWHLSGWLWGVGAILLGLIGAAFQLFRRDHALSSDSAYPADAVQEAGDPATTGARG